MSIVNTRLQQIVFDRLYFVFRCSNRQNSLRERDYFLRSCLHYFRCNLQKVVAVWIRRHTSDGAATCVVAGAKT